MPLNRYLALVAVVLLATVPAVAGILQSQEVVLFLLSLSGVWILPMPAWVGLLAQIPAAYLLLRLSGYGTVIYAVLGGFVVAPCLLVYLLPQLQPATFQYWLAGALFGVAIFAKWQSYYID